MILAFIAETVSVNVAWRDNLKRGTSLSGIFKMAIQSTNGNWACTAGKRKERTEPFLMIFMPTNRPA